MSVRHEHRTAMRTLETLHFDNRYARLPADFHRRVQPTPLADPYLVAFNPDAAALIDLDPREAAREAFVEYFSGRRTLPGSDPVAMLYAGHQFGHYVPQLGDGRAILLGEVCNARGERWDLHLKGAGQTPFSRDGDGRAVLRSTIREYLCSEAMHALGIPTTRALCIVGSDEEVYRESIETGAMLLRMAPSHVRFGSFEVFYYRDQHAQLGTLADHVIAEHFPDLSEAGDRHAQMLARIVARTADLIAQWQAVGFAHGVLNTDNMSVLGITLDYGPFGFLDAYDPGFVCNHSDHRGRYAFDRQPQIGLWNLTCLAQALTPLIAVERCKEILATYEETLVRRYQESMGAKLGLRQARAGDGDLVRRLLDLLAAQRVDYTIFFRRLGRVGTGPADDDAALAELFAERAAFTGWMDDYRTRLRAENSVDEERSARMNRVNPKYVLRNYLAQNAIERATDARDYGEIDRLLAVLRKPFDEQPECEAYATAPPAWAAQIEVSCSS